MKLDNFINRPVLSTVISILIVILGAIGLVTLPITQYPDIAPPTVSVRATYTGASASTVLNSVIAPLEEQINGVENMMYMTSNASFYIFQTRNGSRYGGCQCTKPCCYGTGIITSRSYQSRCNHSKTPDFYVSRILSLR